MLAVGAMDTIIYAIFLRHDPEKKYYVSFLRNEVEYCQIQELKNTKKNSSYVAL